MAGAAEPGVEAGGGGLWAVEGGVAAEAEAGEDEVEGLAGVLAEAMALPDRPGEGGEGGHGEQGLVFFTWRWGSVSGF